MIRLLWITFLSWLPAGMIKHSVPAPVHPNFILILTDDQGWTSLSKAMDARHPDQYNHFFETPNIDRLGDRGMRFVQGYAPAALCTPSRRSIQFGQSPIHIGNILFPENYNPQKHKWLTIPNMLKSVDPAYKTAHYGKWDLRAGIFPEDLGYDESDGNTGNSNGDLMTDKSTKFTAVYLTNDPKRTVTITERAKNFMARQVKAGHPFYMQLSYYATHVDIETRSKTYKKYQEKNKKGPDHDEAGWAGMLEDLDTGIGEVLDRINELGIDKNTYVILMADNGGVEFLPPSKDRLEHPDSFSKKMRNYPLRAGKWTLFEGGIRVPFMVMGPGVKSNACCYQPVTGYDILPTIYTLAGGKSSLPAYLDGGSFAALLKDPSGPPVNRSEKALYFHRYVSSYPHSCIIEGDYKYLKFWKTGKEELYNIKTDLGERNDLAAVMPEKKRELAEKLMIYLKKTHAEILDSSLPRGKLPKTNKNDDNDDD